MKLCELKNTPKLLLETIKGESTLGRFATCYNRGDLRSPPYRVEKSNLGVFLNLN